MRTDYAIPHKNFTNSLYYLYKNIYFDSFSKFIGISHIPDEHKSLLDIVRRHKTNPVLVVGSWDDYLMSAMSFSSMLENEKSRANFLEQLKTMVDKHNVTGVAIYWQFPGCPQVNQLNHRTECFNSMLCYQNHSLTARWKKTRTEWLLWAEKCYNHCEKRDWKSFSTILWI